MREFPQGWASITLAEAGPLVGGKTPSKAVSAFWKSGDVPWTSPKDMKTFELQDSEDKISRRAVQQAGMELLPSGTVLMVTRSGILSHTFPVAITSIATTINQDIKALRPSAKVDSKYLAYALRANGSDILRACKKDGTTVASVSTDALEAFPLPLAPMLEQRRIVAKVERLLASVNACHERLDRVPQILKRFREAVLEAAVSGRLTEDWRGESAQEENWEEGTFGSTGYVSGGLTQNTKRQLLPMNRPFLRVANVYANRLELDEIAHIGLTEAEWEKTRLVTGDLLIVEGNGSLDQIGRTARWNGELPNCSHQNHLIRWRSKGTVSSKFALYYLMSPTGREVLMDLASTSAGLYTLSISKVSKVPIKVPPDREQIEIVRRVDELFALADSLECNYKAAVSRVEKLTPSVLAKAFRGELVPQDPNDEPASVLLERVRREREAKQAEGKPKMARVKTNASVKRRVVYGSH